MVSPFLRRTETAHDRPLGQISAGSSPDRQPARTAGCAPLHSSFPKPHRHAATARHRRHPAATGQRLRAPKGQSDAGPRRLGVRISGGAKDSATTGLPAHLREGREPPSRSLRNRCGVDDAHTTAEG